MSYIIILMRSLFSYYINQLDLTDIQTEAICALTNVLFEDAASTATHKTKRVIREVLPQFSSIMDKVARDDNGNPILTSKGKEQTTLEYLERQIKNTYFHDGKANIKFEPGVARIAYGELGMQGNEDTRKLRILGRILQEISASHASEYDANLNGMSYDELNERFGGTIKQADDNELENLKNSSYDKSNYIIKWIPDFETAKQYSEYTNFGSNEHWCLTYNRNLWESYTGKYNANKVYFCYVPEFEHVERVVGDNAPLDEYGLSLISVVVTPENELRAVTCRWNHTNGGSDGVMDAKQLSRLLGGYVFDLCPPYDKEELKSRGYIPLEDVQQMLDDGVNLLPYITQKGIICINDKYNFVRDGKLISSKWFDILGGFNDGYAKAELRGKWNFIDINGNFLSNQWFDDTGDFNDGYAQVELNDKMNFIDTNGNILSDQWFDGAEWFCEGYGPVKLKDKWNYIDANGNFLSDQWFDYCGAFIDGLAQVGLNGKWNFIDTNGKFISDQWFDVAGDFYDGYAQVKLGGKWNYIDPNGYLLSDQWFQWTTSFNDGYAQVKLNGKWNFIAPNGTFLSDKWFDGAESFRDGHARVLLNGKWKLIDSNGDIS